MPGGKTVSEDTVLWAAKQVVRQHTEPASDERATGTCAQCRPEGCDLLLWATTVVASDGLVHPRT